MKTSLRIATGTVMAAALIFAWQNHQSAKEIRASLDRLAAEHAQINADLDAAQLRLRSASNDEAELQTALRKAESQQAKLSSKTASPTPIGNQDSAQKRPDLSTLMQTHPELREIFKRSFRANLALRYRPLYDAGKFSPEQIDQFESALTEAEQDKMDLTSASAAQGLGGANPEVTKLLQQQAEKLKTDEQAILGEAGYQQLIQYQRTEPLLSMINATAGLVAHTSTPVTMSQVEQMINVLANSNASYQNGGKADAKTIDWDLALPKVQAILSPLQFDSFKANSKGPQMAELIKQYYSQK